jgi:malonate-semialdehyde dehydrogenase (acetylating) / methylmalonate-semialdehyde dehydrogenase
MIFSEVVEHCCSITSLQQGESLNGIARDMDTHSYRTPIGVCAGIAPFNFPAMIPLWVSTFKSASSELKLIKNTDLSQMYPVAMVCGNTFVFKPSERVPGACMMLVQMLKDAGCPDGVVNVIHGTHDSVNFICDNPDIKAISFVGSDQAVGRLKINYKLKFKRILP